MSASEKHLTSLELDELALGGDPIASRRSAAEAHLRACSDCRARQEEAQMLGQRFVHAIFPRTVESVSERALQRRRVSVVATAVVFAVAAACLVFFVRRAADPARENAGAPRGTKVDTAEDIATFEFAMKGDAALRIVAKTKTGLVEVRDGTVLAPGDAIRFIVEPAGLPYVLVVSIDGEGKATVYVPYDGAESMRVEGRTELPGSIVLGEARGVERVFAFFSRQPIRAHVVLTQLRAIGSQGRIAATTTLAVPADFQRSIAFDKGPP
jgi:hypothetical protein